MTRFFIAADQIKDDLVTLEGDDRHHLLNVLRQGIGAELIVINGKGEEFLVEVIEVNPETVTGKIVHQQERRTEPKVRITLVQSLPKADKFEWILQKNTELGVSRFQPVFSERSNIKLDQATQERKQERWNKIIREAAEQSGRQIVPVLEPVRRWNEMLAGSPGTGLVLIPWEGETVQSLKHVLERQPGTPESVKVLIGPEGGFSLKEVEEARDKGAVPVTLGPRILRTETAGLVVSSALLYHFGDLGEN